MLRHISRYRVKPSEADVQVSAPDRVRMTTQVIPKRPTLQNRPYTVYRAERPSDVLVAILVPVLDRPAHVAPLVNSLRESRAAARLYFIATLDDQAELAACRAEAERDPGFVRVLVVPTSRRSWAKKINDGIRRTTESWLLLAADDIRFHSGWADEAIKIANAHPGAGVIGTNDLGHRGTIEGWHSTHPIVSRKYARELGSIDDRRQFVHEGYRHNFADTEIVATAKLRDAYVHAPLAIVEHLHPLWKKSKTDSTYALGRKHLREDRQLFALRTQKFGWETRG